MTHYSAGTEMRRDGEDVIKVLTPAHPAGPRFTAAAHGIGVRDMHTYVDTLRSASVALPLSLRFKSGAAL